MALAKDDFAQRLVEIRERRRLTQENLAKKAGVHPRQVIRWENAQSMPYYGNIEKLAAALSVEPEILTGDENADIGLPARVARIEAMLELLLEHHRIEVPDAVPGPPPELAELLDTSNTKPATGPAPATRRRPKR